MLIDNCDTEYGWCNATRSCVKYSCTPFLTGQFGDRANYDCPIQLEIVDSCIGSSVIIFVIFSILGSFLSGLLSYYLCYYTIRDTTYVKPITLSLISVNVGVVCSFMFVTYFIPMWNFIPLAIFSIFNTGCIIILSIIKNKLQRYQMFGLYTPITTVDEEEQYRFNP